MSLNVTSIDVWPNWQDYDRFSKFSFLTPCLRKFQFTFLPSSLKTANGCAEGRFVSFTGKRTHWTQIPAGLRVWKATCERGLWVDTLSPFKLVPIILWFRFDPIFFTSRGLISIVPFIRYLLQQDVALKILVPGAKLKRKEVICDPR